MIQNRWDQSLSPGNEQSFYWGSEAADIQGTRNYMGAKDPADRRHDRGDAGGARAARISSPAVRALDRVLMSGFYVIPLFNVPRAMDRALESDRTACSHCVVGLSAGNLVAKTGCSPTPIQMMRSDAVTHDQRASPTLDGSCSAASSRGSRMRWRWSIPSNKQRITGQPPKRLTFAQADRAISALAAHFIEAGLPANSVIAVQLPNTVEFMLTVLAAHRAGLIVALLPLLWRQAELTVALNRTGARAIVTTSRIDGVSHADLAMNAAAEAFSIRHVCGFGDDLPEGMASLDRAIAANPPTPRARHPGRPQGGDHLFRRDRGWFSRGAAHPSEPDRRRPRAVRSKATCRRARRSCRLSRRPPSRASPPRSRSGCCRGGTLALHHPFDQRRARTADQRRRCDTLIAPAQLALRLAETDMRVAAAGLAQCDRAVARAGTGRRRARPGAARHATLTDVYLFGEAGLFGARRGCGWRAGARSCPDRTARRATLPGSSIAGEILLTPQGTLACADRW